MTTTTGFVMCSDIESKTMLEIESVDNVKFDTPYLLINGLQFNEYILNTMNPNQSGHHIRSDTYDRDFFTSIIDLENHTNVDDLGTNKQTDVIQTSLITTDYMSIDNTNYPYINITAPININISAGHVDNIFYGNITLKTYISSILNPESSANTFEKYDVPVLKSMDNVVSGLVFRATNPSSIKLKCKIHGTIMGSSYQFPNIFSTTEVEETIKINVTVINSKYVLKIESTELTNQYQFYMNNIYIFDQTDVSNLNHPLEIINDDNEYVSYQRRTGIPGEMFKVIDKSTLGSYKCKSIVTNTLSTTSLFDSTESSQETSLTLKSRSAINISSIDIYLNSIDIREVIKSLFIEDSNDFTILVNTTPAASSLNYELTSFVSKITNTFMYSYNLTLKLYEKNVNSGDSIPYTLNNTNDKQINNVNNQQYIGHIGSFTNLTPSNQYEIRCRIQNTHTLKFIEGEKTLLSSIVLIILTFELVTNNVYTNIGNRFFDIYYGNVVYNEYFDIEISYSYYDYIIGENSVLQSPTRHYGLTTINSSISTDQIDFPSWLVMYYSDINILIDLKVTDGSGQIVNAPQFSITITLPSIQLDNYLSVNPDNRKEFFVNFLPIISNISTSNMYGSFYEVTVSSMSSSIKYTTNVFTYDLNNPTTPYLAFQIKDSYLTANNYFDIMFMVTITDSWGYSSNEFDYNNIANFNYNESTINVYSGDLITYDNGAFTINIHNYNEIKSVDLSYVKHGETEKTTVNIYNTSLQFPDDFVGGLIDITVNATNMTGFINTYTENDINFFDRMYIDVQNQLLNKNNKILTFNVSASGTATNNYYVDSNYFTIRLSLYSNDRQYITEFILQLENEYDDYYYYGGSTSTINNREFSIELSESIFINLQQYTSILLIFDITDYYGFSTFVEKPLIIPIVFEINDITAESSNDRAFIVTGEIVTNIINVEMYYEYDGSTTSLNLVESLIDQDGIFKIVDFFEGGPVRIIATEQYGNQSDMMYTFPAFYINLSNAWMRPNNGFYSITCKIDYQLFNSSMDIFIAYIKQNNNQVLYSKDILYLTNSTNSFTIEYDDFVTSIPDNVSLLNNEYIIEVYCRDIGGFEKSSQTTFTIDYTPPTSSTIDFLNITRVFNTSNTTITWTKVNDDILSEINPYNSIFEGHNVFEYIYNLQYKNSLNTWVTIEQLLTTDVTDVSISNAPILNKYPDYEFRIMVHRTPYSAIVSNTLSYLGLGENISSSEVPQNPFTIIWYQNVSAAAYVQIYTLTNSINKSFAEYDGHSTINYPTTLFVLEEVSSGNIYRLKYKQTNTYLNKYLSYVTNTSHTEIYLTLTLNPSKGYSMRFVESGEYLYMNSSTLTLATQLSEPTSGSFGFYNNSTLRFSPSDINTSLSNLDVNIADGNYDLSNNSYIISIPTNFNGVYDVISNNLSSFETSQNTLRINLSQYSTTNTVVTIKLLSLSGIIVHVQKTIESATIDITTLTYDTNRTFKLIGTYSDLNRITISHINNYTNVDEDYNLISNTSSTNKNVIHNISKINNKYNIEFANGFTGGDRRLTAYLNDTIKDSIEFNINTILNAEIEITFYDDLITSYIINGMEDWILQSLTVNDDSLSNINLPNKTFDISNSFTGNLIISAVSSYGFERTHNVAIANNVLTITGLTQLNEINENLFYGIENLILNNRDYDVTNRFYIEGDYDLSEILSVTTTNPNIGDLNLDKTSSTNKAIITLPSNYRGGNFDLRLETSSKSATKTITMFPLRNPFYKIAYIRKMDTTIDGDFFKNIFHIDTDTLVEPIIFIHKIYTANGDDTGFEFVHVNDHDNRRGEYNINSMYIDESADIYVFKTVLIDRYFFEFEIQYTHNMNSSSSLYEFDGSALSVNLPGTITSVQTSTSTTSAQLVDASGDPTSSRPFEFNANLNNVEHDDDIEMTIVYNDNDENVEKTTTFSINPLSILSTSGTVPSSSSSSSQTTSGVQVDIVGIYAKNAINNISIVNENAVPLPNYDVTLTNYDGNYAKIIFDEFTPDGTYTITSSTFIGTTSSTSYTVNFGDTSSISLPTEPIQVSANNVSYIIQNIPDTMSVVNVNHGTYDNSTNTLTIPDTFSGNIEITIQNDDGFKRIINYSILTYNIVINNLTQSDQSSILGYNLEGSNFMNVDDIIITRTRNNVDMFENKFNVSTTDAFEFASGTERFVNSVTRISDTRINVIFNTLFESTYVFKLSNNVTNNLISRSLPFEIPTFSKPVMTLHEVTTDTSTYVINLPSSSLSFVNVHALNFDPVTPGLNPVPLSNPISSVTQITTTQINYSIQSTYDGALIVNANSQGIDYSYEYTITSYFMAIDSISYEFENSLFKYTLNGTYDLDFLTNIVIDKHNLTSIYTFNSVNNSFQALQNLLDINSITINSNNKIQVRFNTLLDGDYVFTLSNDNYTTTPYILNINSLTITEITNRNSIYEYVLTSANIDTVIQIETHDNSSMMTNTYTKDLSTSTFYMSSGAPIIQSVVIESPNKIVLTFTSSGLQNTNYTFTISNSHTSTSITRNIIPVLTLIDIQKYNGSNLEYKLVGNNHVYVNQVTVRNNTFVNNFNLSGTTFHSTDTYRFVDEVIMNTNGDIVISFNGTELSPGDNTFTVVIYHPFSDGQSKDVTITIEARFPPHNKRYALFCIKGFVTSNHSFYLFNRTSTAVPIENLIFKNYEGNYTAGSGNIILIKENNTNNNYIIRISTGLYLDDQYHLIHPYLNKFGSFNNEYINSFEINKSITGIGYSIKVVDHNVYMRLNSNNELVPTTDGNEPIDMSFFFINIEDDSVYPLEDNMHVSSLTSITNTPNTNIPIFSIQEFSINTDSSSVHSISYTFTVSNPDKVASILVNIYNTNNDIIYTNPLTSIQPTISVSSSAITMTQSGTYRIEASVDAANIELTTVYQATYDIIMPPDLTIDTFTIDHNSDSLYNLSYKYNIHNVATSSISSINVTLQYTNTSQHIYSSTALQNNSDISETITLTDSGNYSLTVSASVNGFPNLQKTQSLEVTIVSVGPTGPPPYTNFYILVAVPNSGGYEIKFLTRNYLKYSPDTYNKPTLDHSDILDAFNQFSRKNDLESFKIEENGEYFTILPQSNIMYVMLLGNKNGTLSEGRHDARVNNIRNDPNYKWILEPYDGWFSLQVQSGLYWTTDLTSNPYYPYYPIIMKNDASVKAHIIFLNTDGSTLYNS